MNKSEKCSRLQRKGERGGGGQRLDDLAVAVKQNCQLARQELLKSANISHSYEQISSGTISRAHSALRVITSVCDRQTDGHAAHN